MTQVFTNNAITQLSTVGGINNSVTTFDVASAFGFPVTGNYTIIMDSELMLVVGGQGTITWTVLRAQEGTAAVSHVQNTLVKLEISVAGMNSLGDGFWPSLRPSGLTGATNPSRWVGGSSGAPTSGTFMVGDFTTDPAGIMWICSVAGTPGTFVAVGGTPPGSVTLFAGGTIPSGWLRCDGAAYSTATYGNLFASIGYSFGGAGASFQVPDLQGRVPLGSSVAHSFASTGGAETSSVDTSHGHTTDGQGNHNHGVSTGTGIYVNQNSNVQTTATSNTPPGHYHTATTAANGNHGHNVSTGGGALGFGVLNPYLSLNFIIKT